MYNDEKFASAISSRRRNTRKPNIYIEQSDAILRLKEDQTLCRRLESLLLLRSFVQRWVVLHLLLDFWLAIFARM